MISLLAIGMLARKPSLTGSHQAVLCIINVKIEELWHWLNPCFVYFEKWKTTELNLVISLPLPSDPLLFHV